MAIVYNATNEVQSFKAAGNWFTFKPGQMKQMNDDLASFVAVERKDFGVVVLPTEFEDHEFINTPEGKEKIAECKKQGIENYTSHLRRLVFNNQVSLRQDLEKANIKMDPAALASDGEIKAMKLLSQYQNRNQDEAQAKIEQVKKLMGEIGPNSTTTE